MNVRFLHSFVGIKPRTTVFIRKQKSIHSYNTRVVCDDISMNDTESADTLIKLDMNNILFYGPITRNSCFQLQCYLREFEKKRKMLDYNEVKLHIQSQGGELLPAFYVSDYIKKMRMPVHTYIDSYAASAATLISVAGKRRYMSEHSLLLVHQLSSQISGKYDQFNVEVANLNTIMNLAKDIYIKNSNLTNTELDELLSTDLWLNSSVALSMGMIDEII
tara:strand:+ start:4276 stop:4932 length:657 start_codon:yes stop_codon:yes gene_type:complete